MHYKRKWQDIMYRSLLIIYKLIDGIYRFVSCHEIENNDVFEHTYWTKYATENYVIQTGGT